MQVIASDSLDRRVRDLSPGTIMGREVSESSGTGLGNQLLMFSDCFAKVFGKKIRPSCRKTFIDPFCVCLV